MNRLNGNPTQAETTTPKLNERFIQKIKGREFCLYAGLLDLAHQHGLQKLEVELIQTPSETNNHTTICKATATKTGGSVFSDIGDADSSNVNSMIAPHIIRMASTRAKARCLRDMTNIGFTCLEELGDMEDVSEQNHQQNHSRNNNSKKYSNGMNLMTEAQRQAILNMAKRKRLSDQFLNEMIKEEFSTTLDQLNVNQASTLIQMLQKE